MPIYLREMVRYQQNVICQSHLLYMNTPLTHPRPKTWPPIALWLIHIKWLCIDYFKIFEAKSGVKSTTLNKVLDKYQFIRASCGFNETCSHNIPLPISSTTRDLSRRLCELIHHGWRGCSRTKPPTKLRQDSFQLDSTRLIRILRCHLRSQIAPKESFTWPNITPLRSHLRSQQASFLCRELKSLAPRLLLTLPLPIVFDLYLKPFNRMLSVPARHSPLNVVLSGCVCDSLEICYDFQATTITHEWIHGVYVDVHATYS